MELLTPASGLIIWQVILFLVVLFILSKFVWKPIIGGIKEREESITESLELANKAKLEMEKLQADNKELLKAAQLERDKILKEAKEAAVSMVESAKDKANKEGAKMLSDAKQAIQSEKNVALKELQTETANLSIQIAEKILRKELKSDAAQKELVSEYLQDTKLN